MPRGLFLRIVFFNELKKEIFNERRRTIELITKGFNFSLRLMPFFFKKILRCGIGKIKDALCYERRCLEDCFLKIVLCSLVKERDF